MGFGQRQLEMCSKKQHGGHVEIGRVPKNIDWRDPMAAIDTSSEEFKHRVKDGVRILRQELSLFVAGIRRY